jgi:predicted Zn-dependent protease
MSTDWNSRGRRQPGYRAIAGFIVLAFASALLLPTAAVQAAGGIPVVRDAETEALIYDYLRPIFKAAGVSPVPRIHLVQSDQFNAFVTGREDMFVNTGAIIRTETPNELTGILAHETGHIANNDIARLSQQMQDSKSALFMMTLLGAGAVVAGAATRSDDAARAGTGVITGSSSIIYRSLLTFRRDQESAADRNGVKFLTATGQSAAGMLAVLKRLANDELLVANDVDPYLQNHPLSRERVIALEDLVTKSPYFAKKDPPELQRRHDLVRAKIAAFTWPPQRVLRQYPFSDTSLPARYARAIVAYRSQTPAEAQRQIDGLIQTDPSDPYFFELKGQALLDDGQPAAALAPLRKAVSLAPNAALIKILLGQALVALGDRARAAEAIEVLNAAMAKEPDMGAGYRALGRAYALAGNEPMAQLATAQGLFAEGNYDDARIQAIRAQAKLTKGSPAWLRADDIASYKPSSG